MKVLSNLEVIVDNVPSCQQVTIIEELLVDHLFGCNYWLSRILT
jgi:hypothetical protein